MKVTTKPIKYYGGKSYLAARIVEQFPKHLHYVEPYAGGLSVLLERDPNDQRLWVAEKSELSGVSEVINDLNSDLANFWKFLACPVQFPNFLRQVQATPLSQEHFNDAGLILDDDSGADDLSRAVNFFILARQSRAGTFKGFTSLTRSRTRRGINGNASEWLGAVEGLPEIHSRLLPVVILNDDALKVIRLQDTQTTLFYLDPPYLHETRRTKDVYALEMSDNDHRNLIAYLVNSVKGKVILSGYHSDLYDTLHEKHGWRLLEFDLANHAAGGKTKRRMTECLWLNFPDSERAVR